MPMNEQALPARGLQTARVGLFRALDSMTIEDDSDALFTVKKMLLSLQFRANLADRHATVKSLVDTVSRLEESQIAELATWCNGYFEKLLSLLRLEYGSEGYIHQLTHIFRWGLDGVCKDVPFARSLLEQYAPLSQVMRNPGSFPRRIVYNHCVILHEMWIIAVEEKEQKQIASLALPLLRHLVRGDDYIKNRAQYILACAFLVLDNLSQSAACLVDALTDRHAVPSHNPLVITLLFKGHDHLKPPASVRSAILNGKKILDPEFWDYLAAFMPHAEVLARFKEFAALLRAKGLEPQGNTALDTASENTLRAYWRFFHQCESQPADALVPAGKALLAVPGLDNASALEIYKWLCVASMSTAGSNPVATFFYANEALYIGYSREMATALQRAFLEADQSLMQRALFELEARKSTPALGGERALATVLRAPREVCWVTGKVEDEIPLLQWLAELGGDSDCARLATARLASLFIRGECSQDLLHLKIQRYREAEDHLEELTGDEHLVELRKRLESFGFYKHQGSLIGSARNGEFIWLDAEGSDELIIAFADRFSHHVFPSVPSFLKHRKTNILFVNNGPCNWYSDAEEARIDALLQELVLPRFPKDKVTCYHGSMGGYGAIKFALRHGFSAITFNPQINLDLWALDRPADAERLLGIEKKVNLEKLPVESYENLALCLVTSSNPADAMAFQVFLEKLRWVKNINLLLEKHPIREHEAVAMKVHGDKLVDVVTDISRHLRAMKGTQEPGVGYRELAKEEFNDLVRQIKSKNSGRWEFMARGGQWHIAV